MCWNPMSIHSDYRLEVTITNMSDVWPGGYEQYVFCNPMSIHSDYGLQVTKTNMADAWPGWYAQYVLCNIMSINVLTIILKLQ